MGHSALMQDMQNSLYRTDVCIRWCPAPLTSTHWVADAVSNLYHNHISVWSEAPKASSKKTKKTPRDLNIYIIYIFIHINIDIWIKSDHSLNKTTYLKNLQRVWPGNLWKRKYKWQINMKRFSSLLVVREIQIKMRYCFLAEMFALIHCW